MGVIQRQGIKDSIVTYIGIAFGVVNTLVIYPYLPSNVLGLFQFLVSAALIVTPFLQLGMQNVAVRFFPIFKNEEKKHQGFLFILLIPSIICFFVFAIAVILLEQPITNWLKAQDVDPIARQFILYFLPFAFFITINSILGQYIKNFLRIVIPTFLDTVWLKIATGFMALLFTYTLVNIYGYITGIIIAYGLVTIGLLIYTRWLGQLHLQPDYSLIKEPTLFRDIRIFAFYGIIGSLGASFMTYIDKFMIPLLMGKEGLVQNGIFTIVAFIGNTVDTPRKSLEKITQPIVADAIVKENWSEVEILYKRSAVNLLVLGLLLFLGIWLNIDSLFDIMKEGDKYRADKNIVFVLGMASLVDMATSINNQIIGFSKYFRFQFYVVLTLAALNVIFLYVFIKIFNLGIYGAALGTLFSIIVFNGIKLIFIQQKFKMQPFSMATVWILMIGAAVYGIASQLPDIGHPILTILYKSIIISILYIIPIFYFKLAPDFNQLVDSLWQKAKKYFNF